LKNRLTKDSAIFAIELVIDIGLISCSTVLTGKDLGNGDILAIFHSSGTTPCRSEEFIIAQIGAANK
jgi:uncharacterized protein YutE (UPF0331/DUF86 family)